MKLQLENYFFKWYKTLVLILCMNNSLKVLEVLTNPNLDEEFLKASVLQSDEHFNQKLAVLFRRYYGVYTLNKKEATIEPDVMIKKIVQHKREKRFEEDKYWSIWKEEGHFFGFIEGFFHAQEGKNQLCKVRGRKLNEDFLLTKSRQSELKLKFGIENQVQYFKNPDVFAFRFRTLEEFRVFLRINKIERMVGRREGMVKGMHYNIYEAGIAVAKDEALKQIFKEGVLNKETGEIEKKFFDSELKLTKNGLYAVLASFKGYGPKIAKMVLNLVFDVPIVAVDRRVLRSALALKLVALQPAYFTKIKFRHGMEGASEKELIDKISSLSEKYALEKTEEVLNVSFSNSAFLSEADYLLFMYNGGDGWNFKEDIKKLEEKSPVCRVGKCCFDEAGVCLLRRKFEYKEYTGEEAKVAVLRTNG